MRIGWSTGYREAYWGDWFSGGQLGGSERIVVEMAAAMALAGHEVTVRLPYPSAQFVSRGVRYIGQDAGEQVYDILFLADDFARADCGGRNVLVACRSDPPPHTEFDQLVFLSRTHARLMGHADRPALGGGVTLTDYASPLPRLERRVICTSSPDRCPAAPLIGQGFDFVHSYRSVPGLPPTVELSRAELVRLQRTARVLIYPLDPVRPSDFFSMSVLEAMAAGTPVVVSDADAMAELWADVAVVLPRPVSLGVWSETVEHLLTDREMWRAYSVAGKKAARRYSWPLQSERLLTLARG